MKKRVLIRNKTTKAVKYVCPACGYIYDPEIGDPERDILPGTIFENLPETWACPLRSTEKQDFFKAK